MNARPPLSRTLISVCAFAVAAIVVTPLQARAQTSTTYTFGVSGGLAVPTGNLSDFTSSGYSIAVALGMHQALVPLAFRVEGSFTELPWNDRIFNNNTKRRIFGIDLDGIFNLGTPSTNGGLYLTGGVGYYGSNDSDNFGDTNRDWNFGLNGGLGYYLPLSGFSVVFEGRYTHVFSDPSQGFFPITVGVTF
jgi:hypothetical protein